MYSVISTNKCIGSKNGGALFLEDNETSKQNMCPGFESDSFLETIENIPTYLLQLYSYFNMYSFFYGN
jgi:hypothetical protein